MNKSHVFLGWAFLMLGVWATHNYDVNSSCYDVLEIGTPLHGPILLDKCKGRTWTLVQDETTINQLGYASDDGEDKKIKTLVWTSVSRGGGVLTIGEKEK